MTRELPAFLRDMLAAPPRAGEGVHAWLFRAARQLWFRDRLAAQHPSLKPLGMIFLATPNAYGNRLWLSLCPPSFVHETSGEPTPAVRNGSVASGKIQLVCNKPQMVTENGISEPTLRAGTLPAKITTRSGSPLGCNLNLC
jgi:hypothetical protein